MDKTRWQYSIQLVCCFSMGILHSTSLGISTIFSIALCWLCSGVPSLAVSFESEASAPSPRVPLTWWRASKTWNLYTFWPWSAVEAAWLCSRHLTCAWWAGTSRPIPHSLIDWPVSRNWWSLLYLWSLVDPGAAARGHQTHNAHVLLPASTVDVRPLWRRVFLSPRRLHVPIHLELVVNLSPSFCRSGTVNPCSHDGEWRNDHAAIYSFHKCDVLRSHPAG